VVAVPVTVYEVFVVGVAEIVGVVAPVLHEYVEAPVAVKTAVLPTQTAVDVATTDGNALIEMVWVIGVLVPELFADNKVAV
jgi:hypothetical protein